MPTKVFLGAWLLAASAGAVVTEGNLTPTGKPVQVDFPLELRQKNTGGSDGAGLCVFASIKNAARWQSCWQLYGFFEWMQRRPGGGWPDKVDKMIAQFCKEMGRPVPAYIQVPTADLPFIEAALKSGRMPCVTYSFSPTGRYGGAGIAHMVNLVHGLGEEWGVADNNYPGVEWMDRKTWERVHGGKGGGWTVILLEPPPPPPVWN